MFERFTDRARRVLVLAQEEAGLLDHNFIGTEHILLGLVREGDGVAGKALEALGISLQEVRDKVKDTIGPAGGPTQGAPPFTPRTKKVLELSLREALELGHDYIGTEHILLGLVREGEGVAAQVLVLLGAELSGVRQTVVEALWGSAARGHPRAGVAGENVERAEVPAPARVLFGWDDAAEALGLQSLLGDPRTERTEIHGVVYDTCFYVPRQPPDIRVSVAGAVVTREAFDAYTRDHVPDAETIEGLGDASAYSPIRRALRVLVGATLIVVEVHRSEGPKDLALVAARRVLDNLSRVRSDDD